MKNNRAICNNISRNVCITRNVARQKHGNGGYKAARAAENDGAAVKRVIDGRADYRGFVDSSFAAGKTSSTRS